MNKGEGLELSQTGFQSRWCAIFHVLSTICNCLLNVHTMKYVLNQHDQINKYKVLSFTSSFVIKITVLYQLLILCWLLFINSGHNDKAMHGW